MNNSTQYIYDIDGNITSVIIPIDVYQQLLKIMNNSSNPQEFPPSWHTKVLKERLEKYESEKEDISTLEEFLSHLQ